MIYFFVLFIFLVFAINFDYHNKRKNKDVYFKIECLILILLWGLRYRVGGDSLTYEEEFLYYPSLSEIIKGGIKDLPFQPLWYYFNAILKSIIPSFVFFQIVHAIIINVVVFIIINKYCEAKFTAALFYYVFISANMNTEILREAISVCIFLIAFNYLINNNVLKYYLFAIIAFFFHQSAVFLFVLPLFKWFLCKTWTIRHYIVVSSVIAVIVFFALNALEYVVGINLLGNDFSSDKAIRYYAKAVATQDTDTGLGGSQFGIRYLLKIFLSLYVIYTVKKEHMDTPANNFVVHIYLFLTIIGFVVGLVADRWSNYFVVLYYCIIANLLYNSFNESKDIIVKIRPVFIISMYTILFVFNYISDSSNGSLSHHNEFYRRYYPYHSVFDPQKDVYRENLRDDELMQ